VPKILGIQTIVNDDTAEQEENEDGVYYYSHYQVRDYDVYTQGYR